VYYAEFSYHNYQLSSTNGTACSLLPLTDSPTQMDYSIIAVGLGMGLYLVYYCCGRQLLSMYADSEEGDYERDGDQTTRIRHGNL
jgi:hypothetical protein